MNRVNLYDLELDYDEEPEGYGAGYRRVAPLVGGEETSFNLVVLASGQAVRYH